MTQKQINVGIVIRKDGTVPFDDCTHGGPCDCAAIRSHIRDHLEATGHVVASVPGTQHFKLKSGPLAPKA